MKCGPARYICLRHRVERHTEIEVQSLKVPAGRAVQRRDHEVADHLDRSVDRVFGADELAGALPRLLWRPELADHPSEALIGQLGTAVARRDVQHVLEVTARRTLAHR